MTFLAACFVERLLVGGFREIAGAGSLIFSVWFAWRIWKFLNDLRERGRQRRRDPFQPIGPDEG